MAALTRCCDYIVTDGRVTDCFTANYDRQTVTDRTYIVFEV